jgi:putative transcriptional regulator
MKKSELESIKRGMAQAKAFMRGEREGFVVHEPVDIRQVREKLNLTRRRFAKRYRLNERTVEQWEQGRSAPDQTSETLLRLIEREPEKMAKLVAQLD